MKRTTLVLAAFALAVLALAVLSPLALARELSRTDPPINLTHVFAGEVNKRGKPVGFHSRPGGEDPPHARVARIVEPPNRQGVYVADVEIRNGAGRWLRKRSSFYPDRMSRQQVIAAILHAFRGRTGAGEKFRGPSGHGFTIEGYFQNGRINTAYPIYQ